MKKIIKGVANYFGELLLVINFAKMLKSDMNEYKKVR